MSDPSKGGNRSCGWDAKHRSSGWGKPWQDLGKASWGSPGWGEGQDWEKASWGNPDWGDGQKWWNDAKDDDWWDGGKGDDGGKGGAKNRSGGQGAESSSSAAAAAPAALELALVPYRPEVAVTHRPAAWFQEEELWTLAHFESCPVWTDNYQQHNAALKWFREECSAVAEGGMMLPGSCDMPAIVHPPGMSWTFNLDVMVTWSWHEMVAQLDTDSMSEVVNGKDGSSGGLISCEISPRPGFEYCHKMHHQMEAAKQPVWDKRNKKQPVWDFVLTRDDGSGIRLHPQWSTTKVETYAVEGGEGLQPPRAGLGKSDGRGTYKKFKEAGSHKMLRFDGMKRPPGNP